MRALSFVCLAVVCGCAHGPEFRDPRWRDAPTRLAAELQYLAPYSEAPTSSCGARFELELLGRSGVVFLTLPATYESAWELRTCRNTMRAVLDCSEGSPGHHHCGAHEWPMPIEANALMAHELLAAAEAAPAEPDDETREHKKCSKTGFVLARERTDTESRHEPWHMISDYTVSRCGVSKSITVDCVFEPPYRCRVTARPPGEGGR